jgi:flagellar protein FliJ
MKDRETILRGYRWQLEERRREIAELDRLAVTLREQQTKIDREQKEAAAAGASDANIAAMAERRARIEQSLAEIEAQIRAARQGLSEAYYGVRRFEIVAAARAEQQRRRHG